MPNCPICDAADAYIGFSTIECKNRNCEFYNDDYASKSSCGYCGSSEHRSAECPVKEEAKEDTDSSNGPPSNYSAGNGNTCLPCGGCGGSGCCYCQQP
jgi:hypothetical protein